MHTYIYRQILGNFIRIRCYQIYRNEKFYDIYIEIAMHLKKKSSKM